MQMRLPVWARPKDISDLLRLAGPIAVSRMAMMLMSVTDAIVLGQFAPGELPFLLNSYLPHGIVMGFGIGILMGVQVLTAELAGSGKEQETGRIFRRGVIFAGMIGAFFAALIYFIAEGMFHAIFVDFAPVSPEKSDLAPATMASETASVTRILSFSVPAFMLAMACSNYLEGLRRPLIVTVASYVCVLMNVLLCLWFAGGYWGGYKLGAEGVAWATTGARITLMLILLVAVVRLTPALKRHGIAPAGEAWRQLKVGTGSAASNVAEWGGFNSTFVMASWISVAAGTLYGYATQLMGLCFMFYLGIAAATSVRVAEAVGRDDKAAVRDAGRLGVAATILVALALIVALICFNDALSRIFVNAKAMQDGVLLAPALAGLLIIAGVATLFDGLQATASFALRAQGVVWVPSVLHFASFFVVMLPACYYFAFVLARGARGMMEGALLGVFVAAVAQTALLEWYAARVGKERVQSLAL